MGTLLFFAFPRVGLCTLHRSLLGVMEAKAAIPEVDFRFAGADDTAEILALVSHSRTENGLNTM